MNLHLHIKTFVPLYYVWKYSFMSVGNFFFVFVQKFSPPTLSPPHSFLFLGTMTTTMRPHKERKRMAFHNRELVESTRSLLYTSPLDPHEGTYDLEEWKALEENEHTLELHEPPPKEGTMMISDGREVSIFRIPKLSSVCNAGQVHSRTPYFNGIAARFEKLVRDVFGIPLDRDFWLENMEDGMVEDMSQPWDFENRGRYWLMTSETTGVFCTNWKGTSKQKGKKQPLGLSVWGEKIYKEVNYQLGFVSFSYGYDGAYMMEAAVEVRWTSGEPLQKACFVGLEWDEVEGHLDNYYPNQEEKTTTVSHSTSRSYNMTGGISGTAGGPTGGVEMGMSRGRERTVICKEDSYHTQVRSLTNNSIEWVLEFNERSETKKYATHLRKVFKIILKINGRIQHKDWTPALRVTIGYNNDRKLPQVFRARLFHNIFAVCTLKSDEWKEALKVSLDDQCVLRLFFPSKEGDKKKGSKGKKGKGIVFRDTLEVGAVLEWVFDYNSHHAYKKIYISSRTLKNIKKFFHSTHFAEKFDIFVNPNASINTVPTEISSASTNQPLVHSSEPLTSQPSHPPPVPLSSTQPAPSQHPLSQPNSLPVYTTSSPVSPRRKSIHKSPLKTLFHSLAADPSSEESPETSAPSLHPVVMVPLPPSSTSAPVSSSSSSPHPIPSLLSHPQSLPGHLEQSTLSPTLSRPRPLTPSFSRRKNIMEERRQSNPEVVVFRGGENEIGEE